MSIFTIRLQQRCIYDHRWSILDTEDIKKYDGMTSSLIQPTVYIGTFSGAFTRFYLKSKYQNVNKKKCGKLSRIVTDSEVIFRIFMASFQVTKIIRYHHLSAINIILYQWVCYDCLLFEKSLTCIHCIAKSKSWNLFGERLEWKFRFYFSEQKLN